VLKKKTVPAAAYAGFVSDIDAVLEGSAWYLSYKLDKRLAGRQQLQDAIERNPGADVTLAKLIRHHLESGDYQQAKTLADQAVQAHPKSGEIRYLMGVTLGFMGDYEKSGRLINESRALGFRP
jgi:Flp pilus assembly protein TadD